MNIRIIKDGDFSSLEKLFCAYYNELDCDDDPLHLFNEYVLPDFKALLLGIAAAESDGAICGFVIYQIDDVINDWCYDEGKGDIREIYVCPEKRRKGLGKALLDFAQRSLKADGATQIYTLPTDESEQFFLSCGYSDFGGYCAELDCKVFGKNL